MTTIHGFAVAGHARVWPPECPQCATDDRPGWQGEPNDQQSPWIACRREGERYGDPARHIRPATGRTTP